MDEEYLKGRIMSLKPVYHNDIPIYSPTLEDIFDIGSVKYDEHLKTCIIGTDNLKENPDAKISNFDVLVFYLQSQLKMEDYLSSIKFFTKLDFELTIEEEDNLCFTTYDGEYIFILNRHNYDDFIKLIKISNSIDLNEGKKTKSNSKLDEQIAKAKAKVNEKLNKKEADQQSDISLLDLISVLASQSKSLNILNIWNLNICQFNDQFKRSQLIENYDLNIRSLLAGADSKEIQLEHYIKKI